MIKVAGAGCQHQPGPGVSPCKKGALSRWERENPLCERGASPFGKLRPGLHEGEGLGSGDVGLGLANGGRGKAGALTHVS